MLKGTLGTPVAQRVLTLTCPVMANQLAFMELRSLAGSALLTLTSLMLIASKYVTSHNFDERSVNKRVTISLSIPCRLTPKK